MDPKLDYHAFLDRSPTAILVLDHNGIILEVNKKTCEWLQMNEDDLVGRSIFMLKKLPKESKMVALENFEQRVEGYEVEPYEIMFKGEKGELRFGAVSATPILDSKKKVKEVIVSVTDITSLRKGEGFSGSEDLIYRTILDNSAVGIMIADDKERVVAWNNYTEDLLGKSNDELFEKSVKSLYPEEELVKLSALNIRKEGKQSHFETKMYRGDGSTVDVYISISPLKDTDGKTTGSIGIIRDISDKVKLQSHVHESDMKYQMVFDSTAVGIMIANEDEKVSSCNKFAESMLGYSSDEMKDKPVTSFYPEEELKKLSELNIRKDDKQSHIETKMIKKDGSLLDVHISISPLKDASGNATGSIGVIRDITERKLAEEEMFSAVKMKGQFLSMVSHELRTPLTAIRGSLDIIADEAAGPLNDEQKDFLSTAISNIERLDKQISDVLDYQRMDSGREKFTFKENNINLLLRQVEREMGERAKEKNLDLTFKLDESIPDFSFDEDKMTRVFANLLDNAITFTDRGSITVESKMEGEQVCVEFHDTGIGIKQADMEKLFEPFGQISTGDGRKTGNMGLGLVIARSIMKYHKGEIWVKSDPDQGSTFSLYMPVQNIEGEGDGE